MAFTITVAPKHMHNHAGVPKGKTFYFFGYKNGAIQTTDRAARAAVIGDKDIDRLLASLTEKSGTCVFEKQVSDKRANWTLQRLRTPKPKKLAKRRQEHHPKIKRVGRSELMERYAEFCGK